MCGNLYIIVKENYKLIFRQSITLSVIFLLLIPQVYGTSNLDSGKTAECLGKMTALVGIPLYVPVLKWEQDSGIRDVILIKKFPYWITVFLRMVIAVIASAIMIYGFVLYMVHSGCEFPVNLFAVRTVMVSMLAGGVGLLGSALSKNTLVGFLAAFSFVFYFHENFAEMILKGLLCTQQ